MIAFELLAEWALGSLPDADAAAVEEHVFECDECTATASFLLELRAAVPALARAGRLRHGMTPALVDRIRAEGLAVRSYVIEPGGTAACRADPEQVYAITRMKADLAGVVRVDVEVGTDDGVVIETVEDVPFDPRDGAVTIADTGDMVRGLPTMVVRLRVTGFDAEGLKRALGTYRLSHTAS